MKALLAAVFCFVGSLVATPAQTFPETEPFRGPGGTNPFLHLIFKEPVMVLAPPGETNRLFVVERGGRILVMPNLQNPITNVFLELTDTLSETIEAGLLGMAFHPGYATNGRFFTYRTVLKNGMR